MANLIDIIIDCHIRAMAKRLGSPQVAESSPSTTFVFVYLQFLWLVSFYEQKATFFDKKVKDFDK